jgi:hypothetical protein
MQLRGSEAFGRYPVGSGIELRLSSACEELVEVLAVHEEQVSIASADLFEIDPGLHHPQPAGGIRLHQSEA